MAGRVGDVLPIIFGVGGQRGYGFSVQDPRGAPLLSMMYKTKEQAEEAHRLVTAAVASAILIMKG